MKSQCIFKEICVSWCSYTFPLHCLEDSMHRCSYMFIIIPPDLHGFYIPQPKGKAHHLKRQRPPQSRKVLNCHGFSLAFFLVWEAVLPVNSSPLRTFFPSERKTDSLPVPSWPSRVFAVKLLYRGVHQSGQIIATSQVFSPQMVAKERNSPYFWGGERIPIKETL